MAKKRIEDIAAEELNTGLPDAVKDAYDNGLWAIGKKLWNGAVQFSQSGAFKGVLAVAGLAVAGGALHFGAMAAAGQLTNALGVSATLEQGVMMGVGQGLKLLVSNPVGWGALAVGAFAGDRLARQDLPTETSLDDAQAQAREYEKARAEQLQKSKRPAREKNPLNDPELDDPRPGFTGGTPKAESAGRGRRP